MAIYIDDSGAFGQDAEFIGSKGTDYDYDASSEIIWFSATGQAESGFTLPDTQWIIYEVYDVHTFTNDLGGTIVRGKAEFTTIIGDISVTLFDWYALFNIGFSAYKIKATHYKGNDIADVYFADQNAGFKITGGTEEGIEDGTFTGYGTEWLINDTLIADTVIGDSLYGPELLTDSTMDGSINDGTWTKSVTSPATVTLSGGEAELYQPNTASNAILKHRVASIDAGTYRIGTNVSSVINSSSGLNFYITGFVSGERNVAASTAGWYYTEITITAGSNIDAYIVLGANRTGHYRFTDFSLKKVL